MPQLKVNHITSFSSEDSKHNASNILSTDSTKKWKCQTAGEKSASIVLQLEKASLITGIDIGNEHSAYVEVLVNRSSSSEDYKVLLVMSSFMTPIECRNSTNINQVRMFTYPDLRSPERDEKWDLVKIVCTQPFNRRVQYGLSFVTLHSSDSKEASTPATQLGKFAIRPSSPDTLSAGSLFARRKELGENTPITAAAAIRGAFSPTALQHGSPKLKPKLKDTPATPKTGDLSNIENKTPLRHRNRNELLYNEDEEKPNPKIDKIVEKKNKEKEEQQIKQAADKVSKEKKVGGSSSKNVSKKDQVVASTSSSSSSSDKKRKLNHPSTPQKKLKPTKITKPFSELLRGVTIVISGIENPERSNIRNEALAMGAKYKADWDNSCTHLICAFTNTPKFTQVKGKGKIVNRLWISDCYKERKRFPWRRYALDSKDQTANESEDEILETPEEPPVQLDNQYNGTDTEDEIETLHTSQITDFVDPYDLETDDEDVQLINDDNHSGVLDFFNGRVLYIDKEFSDTTIELLKHYVTTHQGLVVEEPTDVVDYAVASPNSIDTLKSFCPDAKIVRPDWIWECHHLKQLVPYDDYKL